MSNYDIQKICVVGAGNMGHQIALSAALAGFKVSCIDINQEILDKAISFTEKYLPERVAKGRLSQEEANEVKSNLNFTGDLTKASKDADLVIEAVVENLAIKRKIFAQLDEICPSHAIFVTNSSYIVSSKLADVTKRPAQICNMHFFVPALVMKLVEVVKGPHTSDETVNIVMQTAEKMGKTPVLLHKEIYGFLVNRIVTAIKHEAVYLYDLGIASYEDIDKAVVNALGHPMGPFRLMDLTGVDLSYYIGMERYQETGDPKYKPSPIIVEKYVRKEWGRKTGKGFYSYSDEDKVK